MKEYKSLALAVLEQALKDAQSGGLQDRNSALHFLQFGCRFVDENVRTFDLFDLWCHAADLNPQALRAKVKGELNEIRFRN